MQVVLVYNIIEDQRKGACKMSKRGIALIVAGILLMAVSAGIYFFGDKIDFDPSDAVAPVYETEGGSSGDGGGNNYASWGFIAGGFGY